MHKVFPAIICAIIMMAVQSCSKKTHPSPTVKNGNIKSDSITTTTTSIISKSDTSIVVKKNDSISAIKPVVKRKTKEAIPKVIVVNDKYANKSVDGRYYYDLQGHRYWRNNKDGKYYLFNKSMLTDDAFKKPN